MPKQLWEQGFELPIIAVTGDFASGKSTFGFAIDPTPRSTIVLDFEKGSVQLAEQFQADRVDMVDHLNAVEKPSKWELYTATLKMVDDLEAGKYSVAIIDTISPLEEAIKAHVDGNPGQYGISANQVEKAAPLAWNAAKKAWGKLLGTLASKVETVVLVSHLRDQYDKATKKPTGKKEPKGFDTVMQLASLALWLYRDELGKTKVGGKEVPITPHYPKPSAVVLKSRLTRINPDLVDENGDPVIMPVLPRRLPVCTPGNIRKYTRTVLDEATLTEEEKTDFVPGMDLTDQDKAAAEAERQLELERLDAEKRLVEAKKQLLADMQRDFPEVYKSGNDVATALQTLDISYTLADDAVIRAKLVDYGRQTAR